MKKLLFLYFIVFIGISQASNYKWFYNKDKTCSIYDTFEEKYKNVELFWTGKCSNGKVQGYGIVIFTAKINGEIKKIFRFEGKIIDGKYEDEALVIYPDHTIAIMIFKHSKPSKTYWKFGQTYIERTYDENQNKTSEKKITDQAIIKKLQNWYKHTILKKHLSNCQAQEHIFYTKKHFAKKELPPIAYRRLIKCYNKNKSFPKRDNKYISLNEILFMAIRFKMLEGVRVSLKNGADIKYRDNKGRTALIVAGSSSNKKIIQFLLDAGADINAQDDKGYTALTEASKWENLDAVRILLKNGANVNIEDFGKYKYTALSWTIQNIAENTENSTNKKIAEILIKNGAKLSEEMQKFYDKKKYLKVCDKNADGTNNKLDEMVCYVKILLEENKKLDEKLKGAREILKMIGGGSYLK